MSLTPGSSSAGDTLTTDYQVYYQGITWGLDDHELVTIDLFAGAEIRSTDMNIPVHDGQLYGVDYLGGKSVTLTVELWADTAEALQLRIQEWLLATSKKELESELVVQLPNWDYGAASSGSDKLSIWVRPRRRSGPVIAVDSVVGHTAKASVQFWATDPRLYSLPLQSNTVTEATSTGGLTFNATPDFTFGVASSNGTAQITNTGTVDTWPVYIIRGAVTNPSIEVVDQAGFVWTLALNGTLTASDALQIKTHPKDRTILLGVPGSYTASRYSWLQDPNGWVAFEPGINQVTFRGTSAGTPSLEIQYQSAWL
tara:strand:- start:85 stop:1020 length:936 start_codon:yes stop_codon:yes gene_type:complete